MNTEGQRTVTILLAEDEECLQFLAAHTLRSMGLEVLTASSAEEALRLWECHADEIALLFTDIVMPGLLSGFDLAEKIRGERPALPLIFSSGYNGALDHNCPALRDGITYLPKPYRQSELSALISTMLPRDPSPTRVLAA